MDLVHGQRASELFQAQSRLYKHIFNFIGSMSLKCALQLGIPDIIHNHGKPITLPELIFSASDSSHKSWFCAPAHALSCALWFLCYNQSSYKSRRRRRSI